MKDPLFENYSYSQQANSLKMRINWTVSAAAAHLRKGRVERKAGVDDYQEKDIQQLETTISRLRRLQ
jgi:hypothetical protein